MRENLALQSSFPFSNLFSSPLDNLRETDNSFFVSRQGKDTTGEKEFSEVLNEKRSLKEVQNYNELKEDASTQISKSQLERQDIEKTDIQSDKDEKKDLELTKEDSFLHRLQRKLNLEPWQIFLLSQSWKEWKEEGFSDLQDPQRGRWKDIMDSLSLSLKQKVIAHHSFGEFLGETAFSQKETFPHSLSYGDLTSSSEFQNRHKNQIHELEHKGREDLTSSFAFQNRHKNHHINELENKGKEGLTASFAFQNRHKNQIHELENKGREDLTSSFAFHNRYKNHVNELENKGKEGLTSFFAFQNRHKSHINELENKGKEGLISSFAFHNRYKNHVNKLESKGKEQESSFLSPRHIGGSHTFPSSDSNENTFLTREGTRLDEWDNSFSSLKGEGVVLGPEKKDLSVSQKPLQFAYKGVTEESLSQKQKEDKRDFSPPHVLFSKDNRSLKPESIMEFQAGDKRESQEEESRRDIEAVSLKKQTTLPFNLKSGAEAFSVSNTGFDSKGVSFGLNPEVLSQNVNKVMESIQTLIQKPEEGEVKLRLEPKELGDILLKVSNEKGQLQVRMLTENEQAKVVIQESLSDLKEALALRKLKVGQIDVGVGAKMEFLDKGWEEKSQNGSQQKSFSHFSSHHFQEDGRNFQEEQKREVRSLFVQNPFHQPREELKTKTENSSSYYEGRLNLTV